METTARPTLRQQEALADLLRTKRMPTASEQEAATLRSNGWASVDDDGAWSITEAGLEVLRAAATR